MRSPWGSSSRRSELMSTSPRSRRSGRSPRPRSGLHLRDDPARGAAQDGQDGELDGRGLDRGRRSSSPCGPPRRRPGHRPATRTTAGGGTVAAPGTPRQQLCGERRLHDVVVGADRGARRRPSSLRRGGEKMTGTPSKGQISFAAEKPSVPESSVSISTRSVARWPRSGSRRCRRPPSPPRSRRRRGPRPPEAPEIGIGVHHQTRRSATARRERVPRRHPVTAAASGKPQPCNSGTSGSGGKIVWRR